MYPLMTKQRSRTVLESLHEVSNRIAERLKNRAGEESAQISVASDGDSTLCGLCCVDGLRDV